MKYPVLAAIAGCSLVFAAPAAASIDTPVPTANYITFNNSDWAWISPCSPTSPSCDPSFGNLFDYQGSLGWRLPNAAEFALRPQASDFGTASAFACATPYFSDTYTHCDYNDAATGFIWNPALGSQNNPASEAWAIRGAAVPGVPEPSTWAMMLLGFGGIAAAMRRTRRGDVAMMTHGA